MGEDGARSSRPPAAADSFVATLDAPSSAETLDASFGSHVRVSRAPTDRAPPREPHDPSRRYEVLAELGRGGMGRVVLARDDRLGRRVALKMRLTDAGDHGLLRFHEEARATAQLEHPNIVPVYDLDEDDAGQPRFSMRVVEGRSLGQVISALRSGEPDALHRFGSTELLLVFTKVCDAVAYAHSRGVIHRDLKPDNVMIGQFGEVFVMDWGLARVGELEVGRATSGERSVSSVRDSGAKLTMDGALLGTPGYMAPEQARGETPRIDTRSDVFALGAILYELLTLEQAIEGRTVAAILLETILGRVVPPRARAPHRRISEELEAIVVRAMAVDPSDRFQSAVELREAVAEALEGTREAARRRAAAQDKLAHARAHLAQSRELADRLLEERAALEARLKEIPVTQEHLASRFEVFAAQAELDRRDAEARRAFWDAYGALLGATQDDPSFEEPRDQLVRLLLDRARETRAGGDASAARDLETMARQHDAARVAAILDAPASLEVRTRPEAARAKVHRFEEQGPLLVEVLVATLDRTPASLRLPPGSYVLDLEHPERPPVRATVVLEAGEERALDVWIPPEGAVAEGFVYVPGGHYWVGGDPLAPGAEPRRRVELEPFAIAKYPVTMREYAEFLNALAREDPLAAAAHAPRIGKAVYWSPEEDGVYRAPFTDPDGDVNPPDWPVFMMGADDAEAYASFRGREHGIRLTLPTTDEWEVAASGGDGRAHPWGNGFDPALCWMTESTAGHPTPTAVGVVRGDRSPLGMQDVVGNVREWTSSSIGELRIQRSAAWQSSREQCRIGRRTLTKRGAAYVTLGIRLLQRLEVEPTTG